MVAAVILAAALVSPAAQARDVLSLVHAGGAGSPDSTLTLAVHLDNPSARSGGQFTITFDGSLVTPGAGAVVLRAQGLAGSRFFRTSDSTLICVLLDDAARSTLEAGSGAIATVPFHVSPAAPGGAQLDFDIQDVLLADESLAGVDTVDTQGLALTVVVGVPRPEGGIPRQFALGPNAPNPFRDRTSFQLDLPLATAASLRVYDVTGRLVRTLLSGTHPAGRITVTWDGRSDRGQSMPPGVYLYRLDAPRFSKARKMLLLR